MTNMHRSKTLRVITALVAGLTLLACGQQQDTSVTGAKQAEMATIELSDADIENIVRRSYQYVALYNVTNKGAMDPANSQSPGGWNRVKANTALADHNMRIIARPNNDTLYIVAALDLRHEPVIVETPAFDSKYVSLMAVGYDHYVNIPMSTRLGDFSEPSRIMFYTKRTHGFTGEPVEGVDKVAEMTADFVGAIYRVMPHANEPERLQGILDAMQDVRVLTLSEFLTGTRDDGGDPPRFPPYGRTDFDVFGDNFLEVMQFVVNHTTFDPDNDIDQDFLAAMEPLGVIPGRVYDASGVAPIDGARFRATAERIAPQEMAKSTDPVFMERNVLGLFQPKENMTLERLLFQSVIGPIGQPAEEAVYPAIGTTDGASMNAMNDYVIRMPGDQMPPATAFWSLTLYDTENGFFIPNERKKYSVGENAGMALDEDGGITIHVAAEQPEGVPGENWLPLNRGDYGIDLILRIYAPDLERFASWEAPQAELVE